MPVADDDDDAPRLVGLALHQLARGAGLVDRVVQRRAPARLQLVDPRRQLVRVPRRVDRHLRVVRVGDQVPRVPLIARQQVPDQLLGRLRKPLPVDLVRIAQVQQEADHDRLPLRVAEELDPLRLALIHNAEVPRLQVRDELPLIVLHRHRHQDLRPGHRDGRHLLLLLGNRASEKHKRAQTNGRDTGLQRHDELPPFYLDLSRPPLANAAKRREASFPAPGPRPPAPFSDPAPVPSPQPPPLTPPPTRRRVAPDSGKVAWDRHCTLREVNVPKATISVLIAAAMWSIPLTAQMTVTGTIAGSVLDASGQSVPGSKITLTSVNTSETRTTAANETGVFTIIAVRPDTYTLRVEHPGFKASTRSGLTVSANERLALDITLQVGDVTETISVSAEAARVQTDSSEHSAELTTTQLQNLTTRGRDVVSLLRTIPGVQYQADQDAVGGSYGTTTPNIGGTSNNTNILAVDGVVSNDQGTPSVFSSVTTLDAIGEVKVLLNSYQAEYAGNGGAVVQVVTKSGTRDFHGGGYYFVRNEILNANDFFSNRNNVRRPRYRYNTFGGTIGGPIYIPGKWNRDRSKLFGFYNIEQFLISIPGSVNQYTMPTAQERQGDFSQTLDVNGRLIPINDPTTGAQFPNNMIPRDRLNPNGLALMNVLPQPNFFNRAISGGNYNDLIQEVQNWPKRSQLFKIDYADHRLQGLSGDRR